MSSVTIPVPPVQGVPSPETPPARRGRRSGPRLSHRALVLLALAVGIGYFTIGPIAYLIYGTFTGPGGATFEHVRAAYSSPDLGRTLFDTVRYAVGSAVFALVIGSLLAFVVARTDTPAKNLVIAASLVPLIIPGVLHTIAWLLLASPQIGALNNLLGIEFNIFSMWGMIFVQGLHTAPLVFLLTLPAFRGMDPSLEEAALTAGSSVPRMLRKVTLPLAKPALLASLIIAVVTGLESFEVPVLLGRYDGISVMTGKIWYALNDYPQRYGEAGAFAVGLLLLTTLGVFLYSRVLRHGKRYATVTGKGFRPRTIQLGRYRWLAAGFVALYFTVAVVLPILMLVYTSLQDVYAPPSAATLSTVTWDNYERVLSQPNVTRATRNSLVLGISAATAIMTLMAVVAWVIARGRMSGRWLLDAIATAPIAVPSLVMGVSLLFVYLRFPIPVYGTLWILFIAYMTRYMPYGIRYATSAMSQISAELEEASQVAGASALRTFRTIVVPLLLPGLLAGWIYIFIVSFRELASSLLLYSPGREVLSVLIWEQYQNGSLGGLAAVGTMLVVGLVGLVALMLVVSRRFGSGSFQNH